MHRAESQLADRIRAVDGIHVISLRAFLAGGEIVLKNIAPFPISPLRRDDAVDLDEGIAKTTLERLQPLEPEYFAVESNGLADHAVFPGEKLQPESRILQLIHAGEDDNVETRALETSDLSDIEFLRRRGFVIADVNGGAKTGHVAAQNQASGGVPSAMARALPG